jgi:hypothetical protein
VASLPQRPNQKFRRARQALGYGRQELADAANKLLPQYCMLTANDIGKIERGVVTYPRELRRAALRTVLRAESDADIGLVNLRRRPTDQDMEIPDNAGLPHQRVAAGTALELHVPSVIEAPDFRTDEAHLPTGAVSASGDGNFVSIPVRSDGAVIGRMIIRRHAFERLTAGAVTLDTYASAPRARMFPAGAADLADFGHATGGLSDAADDLDSFLTVTRLLASQRQSVAPDVLLSLVEAHRDCLSALFRKAGSDPLRTEIGALLGEASIVASRLWSAQGNRSMALAHCANARRLADNIGNRTLAATARIFESNLHSEAATLIGAGGDVMLGLRMLEEAAAFAHHLNPAARARIAAEQAQAYAVLKLPGECGKALTRARSAAQDIDDSDRNGLFSDWNPARLHVYEGTCRLFLGQPEEAVTVISQALSDMGTDHGNTNVVLAARVDLAGAYAESGKLEKACDILADAHGQLVGIGNRRGIERAHRARERLDRWRSHRAVRGLDQRIQHQLAS